MVKMFCDRCGKEISEDHEYYTNRKYEIDLINHEKEPDDEYWGRIRRPIHLCSDCERSFETWMDRLYVNREYTSNSKKEAINDKTSEEK